MNIRFKKPGHRRLGDLPRGALFVWTGDLFIQGDLHESGYAEVIKLAGTSSHRQTGCPTTLDVNTAVARVQITDVEVEGI